MLTIVSDILMLWLPTAGKKKNVNVGAKGGSAGLDDFQFNAPLDDDYDFM